MKQGLTAFTLSFIGGFVGGFIWSFTGVAAKAETIVASPPATMTAPANRF